MQNIAILPKPARTFAESKSYKTLLFCYFARIIAKSKSCKTLLFWNLARIFAESKSCKTLLFCYLARILAESKSCKTLLFCYLARMFAESKSCKLWELSTRGSSGNGRLFDPCSPVIPLFFFREAGRKIGPVLKQGLGSIHYTASFKAHILLRD